MSAAAQPADPERRIEVLADLENLLEMASGSVVWTSDLGDGPAGRLAYRLLHNAHWLLPLARAGLSMQSAVADASKGSLAVLAEALGEREALEWEPHLRREQRRAAEAEAERDALRAEFAACVRALLGAIQCEVRTRVNENPHPSLCASHRAEAQIALAQPLAAAVLRSPEPAAKETP